MKKFTEFKILPKALHIFGNMIPFIFILKSDKKEVVLLKLKSVLYMKVVKNDLIVFENDSVFYFLSQFNSPSISKRQTILKNHWAQPLEILDYSEGKLKLQLYDPVLGFRTLIYLVYTEELIQNLDQLIGSKFANKRIIKLKMIRTAIEAISKTK